MTLRMRFLPSASLEKRGKSDISPHVNVLETKTSSFVHVYEHEHVHVVSSKVTAIEDFTSFP